MSLDLIALVLLSSGGEIPVSGEMSLVLEEWQDFVDGWTIDEKS